MCDIKITDKQIRILWLVNKVYEMNEANFQTAIHSDI
jgi:hypothetical protein